MDQYYIQNEGDRPDLAAIEALPPEGFIGQKIMPIVPVADKSGTIYYATLTADATAQTSRTAGTAPTSTQISNSSTSFTCLQYEKRGSIVPDEVKQFGGIEKAEVAASKWAKRQVMNAYETAVCAEILGCTVEQTFDAAKFMTQVQTALDDIKLYEGKISLVASTMALKRIVQSLLSDDGYGPAFSRLIAGGSPAVAASGMSFAAWLNGLQMFLGVDQVLAGSSGIWNAGSYAGKIAIAILDDGSDELSHKWRPVFGKTFQFLPDGKIPWQITAVADRVAHNNHLDAEMWFDTTALNTGAVHVIDGVV